MSDDHVRYRNKGTHRKPRVQCKECSRSHLRQSLPCLLFWSRDRKGECCWDIVDDEYKVLLKLCHGELRPAQAVLAYPRGWADRDPARGRRVFRVRVAAVAKLS